MDILRYMGRNKYAYYEVKKHFVPLVEDLLNFGEKV